MKPNVEVVLKNPFCQLGRGKHAEHRRKQDTVF
jgi:hypothetical protein